MFKMRKSLIMVLILCAIMAQTSNVFALSRQDAEGMFGNNWILMSSGKGFQFYSNRFGTAPARITNYTSTGTYTGTFYYTLDQKTGVMKYATLHYDAQKQTIFLVGYNENKQIVGKDAFMRF